MTSTAVDAFLTGEVEDPLIKAGRYQIVPPDGEKPKAHTRITNYAKKIEDGFTLTLWKQRMVLLGAAQRSDITVAALAADDDKQELNRLAEAAMEAAKANVARETGSALHTLCERADRGEILTLPEPWRSDVEAYSQLLVDLRAEVELIEEVVVCPNLGLAGRLDRTLIIDGVRYIADLKTGADLSYSWGSIAIQLALYAGARTIYDPESRQHRPMVECDQSRALIIHLPAGQGTATGYWISLEMGRRGIALVSTVLDWRKDIKKLVVLETAERPTINTELRDYVVARMRYVIDGGHGKELAGCWPDDVPTIKASEEHTEAQLDLILDVCDAIEARHTMQFPEFTDPRGLEKF